MKYYTYFVMHDIYYAFLESKDRVVGFLFEIFNARLFDDIKCQTKQR